MLKSIMIFSLLLLGALLPPLTLTASVNVRIINGTDAKHSRPYMVSVQTNGKHKCGGFLVSNRFVMTAAHCFQHGQSLTVLVGADDLSHSSGRIAVKFYHIHPGYNSTSLLNDIMILQLSQTTKKIKNVKPISIPKKDKDIKPKSKCSVAGWGKQTTNSSASKHLMKVDVTIIDNKVCQQFWREGGYDTSRMLCTNDPRGFCQGDSGGPLVCKNTAVGIVSFNQRNCDKPTKPIVYTKISKFLPWINAIRGELKQELD